MFVSGRMPAVASPGSANETLADRLDALVKLESKSSPAWRGEHDDNVESSMTTRARGFATMDQAKQREIASKGGKAAHHKGTAHEWSKDEAREAGRKGAMVRHHPREKAEN
jgi:general stress protein YciG